MIASAALGASMLMQGASASASSPVAVNCKAQFDAYKVDETTRQACGIKTWPLAQHRSLPGGGSEYVYYMNGHKTVYRIPPNGFNPLLASDADLAKYQLPERPAGGDQLVHWTTMMSRIHVVTPPNFLVSLPHSAAAYRTNWSGYETTGTGMWEAWSDWNEASIGSSCSGSTELTWTGIGGDLTRGSHFLAQIGTETGVPGLTAHNAWWEVIPDYGGIQAISGVVAHAGYGFDAEVEWLSTHYYYFYAYDSYTGNFASFSYGTYSYDGIGADFIMERGQSGSGYTPLSNYSYLNFVDDEVNGRGNGHYLNQYSNAALTMTSNGMSSGRQLSYVSQAVSGTGAFQTHYGPYCS